MKGEASRNVSKEVIGFDPSCKGRGEVKTVDGLFMSLARLDMCISMFIDFSSENENRRGYRQKLYSNSHGNYLVMTAE